MMQRSIWVVVLSLIPWISSDQHQLYFPLDGPTYEASESQVAPQTLLNDIPKNLSEIRGTALYESAVDKVISEGILKLTLAVDATVQHSATYDSVVFAPVSIAATLALVLLGSTGKTFNEVSNIMGFATGVVDIQDKSQFVHEQFGRMIDKLMRTSGFDIGNQVNFATAIFVQNNFPIREVYKQTAFKIYQSEILNLDFKGNPTNSQKFINNWVLDRTKGKIQMLLGSPPPASTRAILASAMYFAAEWEHPFFEPIFTKRRPFFSNGRSQPADIEVDLMINGGTFPYHKNKELQAEIIGFPYKRNQTTMFVVKPINSDRDKLKNLKRQITPEILEMLVANTKLTECTMSFPKISIDSTVDLRHTLEDLGLQSLFDPNTANLALLSPGNKAGLGAQYSPINKQEEVPISSYIQEDEDDIYIFTRMGEANCTELFNKGSNTTSCQQVDRNGKTVWLKKIGSKIGRRANKRRRREIGAYPNVETLDSIRKNLNQNPLRAQQENPGLYADQVIHKVFMKITESGTEAAAATSVSLSRDGGKVSFRVDVPYFFFIRHEETKIILFWGSVNKPTPNYPIRPNNQ